MADLDNFDRVRYLESRDQVTLTQVSSNPNGSLNAPATTFAWDIVNQKLYFNIDGATTWKEVTLV